MSRTNKDSNRVKLKRYYRERWETEHTKFVYEGEKYVWPDFNTAVGVIMRVKYLKKPGVLTKKRKEVDTEDHYLSGSPSWWNNLFHTRPIRRKFKNYCTKLIGSEDLYLLEPLDSNKPHKCYH